MNLAQIRAAVRDLLTAGGGQNVDISNDTFWTDSEINTYINKAQDEVYKIIRRSRSDYFTRILRSTDSALRIRSHLFVPSTLRWVVGQGNYSLPPDFVRMKLISDISSDRVKLRASDIAKNELRILMNTNAGGTTREFLYDIIGTRSLVIRPIPQDIRDFEFIYEKVLAILRDWSTGSVSVTNGSTIVTFTATADVLNRMSVGDELIVGTAAAQQATPDPNEGYPVIKSLDSATQVTLEAPYLGATASGVAYRVSSVSEIPVHHHQMLVAFAASQGFKKGTNPHLESADLWRAEFDAMIPSLVADVETRHGSDFETVDAYLEDGYDA